MRLDPGVLALTQLQRGGVLQDDDDRNYLDPDSTVREPDRGREGCERAR
jgi:hypothetical protein